jgi:translation initiation factor 3 subunit M
LRPFPGSPQHGTGLALTVLTTMFNITPPGADTRYHVLLAILRTIRAAATAANTAAPASGGGSSGGQATMAPGAFDAVRAQLAPLDAWLEAWDVEPADARQLLLAVAQAGGDAGDADAAYAYTVRALRTFSGEGGEAAEGNDAGGAEARRLALAALRSALEQPTRFDFQDLAGLDAVQALRRGAPEHFALLELFTAEQLDDLADFREERPGWLEKEGFDVGALVRKMRLLTLASLAASSGQARALTYEAIARALRVPEADVEVWVIDVIRAGLVEGKLSQLSKQFLIHRSTYRVFGDSQWREIAARLDMWKTSLTGVLAVVREERKNSTLAEPKEGGEGKADGLNGDGGRGERGGRGDRGGQRNRQPRMAEADAD